MTNSVSLGPRDYELLRLLEKTPATTSLILKASRTFQPEPFRDERRIRERLQTLAEAGYVRAWPAAAPSGGWQHYHKLTPLGFSMLHDAAAETPTRTFFAEIAPSRFQHTLTLAEVIVHTLVACHEHRIQMPFFYGENSLLVEAGSVRQYPDCFFQFEQSGQRYNMMYELDNSTESIDSHAEQSIRRKIAGYETYQDALWHGWKQGGERGVRPYFRVLFLTKSQERANHILWFARETARNRDRHLCLAATQDAYLATPDAIRTPIVNDHDGHFQALFNPHPTSRSLRTPIRLTPPLALFGP